MANPPGQGLLIIERILRDRESIWRQIEEERDLKGLTVQMLISSAVSLAIYGAVLGASYGFFQSLSSMVKLPLLFLATLVICLPTLYLFNLVFGARLSMMQAVALIMVSITVTAVLTLAFAPISLFFLITAQSYSFFKLLNICILFLTSVVGLRFLTAGMNALNQYHLRAAAEAESAERLRALIVEPAQPAELEFALIAPAAPGDGNGTSTAPVNLPEGMLAAPTLPAAGGQAAAHPVAAHPVGTRPEERPASLTLLYIWILLFGFVGTQLAWTLRPFFGSPGEPFGLFRHIDGTFYGDLFRTIGHLLTG